jgi:tRNA pseudouridine55 synthase
VTASDGVAVVDKPGGLTSHDVVARVRRLAGTRRVGHAGTLDPMATGVLVVGIGRATRLLGYLALTEKVYVATLRLGLTTSTDDIEGVPLTSCPAGGVSDAALHAAAGALVGQISQVPPAVSAIKVDGTRSYARVRAGETVELAAREVTVFELVLTGRHGDEVDFLVRCSSGTYVRALARDIGAAVGVGATLSALRRTRVGPFETPVPLPQSGVDLAVLPLADVVRAAFSVVEVGPDDIAGVRCGRPLPAFGLEGPVGVFRAGGGLLALMADRDGLAKPLVVFDPA